MGGAQRTRGQIRNAYKLLVGKSQGKKPFGRPRDKWGDNIKTDVKDTGCGLDSTIS